MSRKRITAVVLAAVLIVCSFSFSLFSASAKTQQLILDTEIINSTDGLDDKNWYYFTPEQTGMYTFLSFNRYLYAEAYLFIKEGKNYTQLAYSNKSENYEYYGQKNEEQFCLSYQLEAGKTYYYAAGWDSSRTSGEMKVKLIYEGGEEDVIERLEVECNAELTWYTNGSWETDSEGQAYFFYDYSRIIQNMRVSVHYKNGSVSTTLPGANTVDGYTISFSQKQNISHWYPKEDEKYTGNYLTVSILNVSTVYDVTINQEALFNYYGSVCDIISGEGVEGATVSINGFDIATTDSEGNYSYVSSPGVYRARVRGKNIIPRNYTITVVASSDKDSRTPVEVAASDYVSDGIINAKDLGYINKNFSGAKRETEAQKFSKLLNFTENSY